jgi:hypothetical protein
MSTTTETREDGYGGIVTIVREYDDSPYGTVRARIVYKGKTVRKSAKGETAHHAIERWVNDNLIRVIHAGMGIVG